MTIPQHIPAGTRFGKLTVIREVPKETFHRLFLMQCDCGRTSKVALLNLRNGHTRSCGCLKFEAAKVKHGHSKHGTPGWRTYAIWHDMRTRCQNARYREFHLYGGRGIRVCDRWNDYRNFLADMGEAPAGLTIERKDVDGDYELGNCRWATPTEQANNKRNNVIIQYDGRRQTVAQWARELGLNAGSIYYRVSKGLTGGRALGLHGKPG